MKNNIDFALHYIHEVIFGDAKGTCKGCHFQTTKQKVHVKGAISKQQNKRHKGKEIYIRTYVFIFTVFFVSEVTKKYTTQRKNGER